MPLFQTSPGTRDLLPPESTRARRLVDVFATVVEPAGYGLVVPPLFEDLGVFTRIGEETEIVSKEMYDFVDKGGRHVALRPEMTASIVRAFVQHHVPVPWKVWCTGPNFRYESAQKGRYRQFEQVDLEVLGVEDPQVDAEVIALAWELFRRLGLSRVTLLLNSLGDPTDRRRYTEALRAYLSCRRDELSQQSAETLERNPLRVLDSKRPEDRAVVAEAPLMTDFLSSGAAEHFAATRAGLDDLGVPYSLAPRLVRGLDYYVRTTFELIADGLDAAQNAVGGGGRYDGLAEALGGPPTPGIGFALGVDRTLLACDAEGVFEPPPTSVDLFVVDTTGGREALVLTHQLRRAGWRADRSWDGRSMRAQMKAADRSGAMCAIIVGPDELAAGAVTLRPLRGDGPQHSVARSDLLSHVERALS